MYIKYGFSFIHSITRILLITLLNTHLGYAHYRLSSRIMSLFICMLKVFEIEIPMTNRKSMSSAGTVAMTVSECQDSSAAP